MHFDDVGAIFQLIVLPDGAPGQLALLAQRHEAGPEPVGHRAAQNEAARLDADHGLDAGSAIGFDQPLDAGVESRRMFEQRGHVAKHDAGLRIVGNRPHQRFQIEFNLHAFLSSRLVRRCSKSDAAGPCLVAAYAVLGKTMQQAIEPFEQSMADFNMLNGRLRNRPADFAGWDTMTDERPPGRPEIRRGDRRGDPIRAASPNRRTAQARRQLASDRCGRGISRQAAWERFS